MTKRNKSDDQANAHLGREDWVDAAWQLLGRGGLDQVRVDALARHLNVTRGSFYWHFKNRDDLIDAILQRWYAALGLEQRMGPLLQGITDPGERLWAVYREVVRSIDNSQFAALRLSAQSDPVAQSRLDAEDKARLAHMALQFRELGLSPDNARARASIYHALVVSEYLRCGTLPIAERLRRAKMQHSELISR